MTAVTRRAAWAILPAALILAAVTGRAADHAPQPQGGVVTIPCRPVNGECTGTADIPAGTRLVILEPGDGADMVARQIRDLHRRTP